MTALICPRCHEPLAPSDVPSLPIAACARCGGAWVDAKGCGALAEDARPEVATRARELAEGAVVEPDVAGAIACPACGKAMARHTLPGASLTLDRCEHGTWFDRGELRTVAFLDDAERASALPFEHSGGARPGWGGAAAGATGAVDLVLAIARLFSL